MAENTGKPRETGPFSARKRPRPGVLVEPFQRQLYEMIVRQLHHDGFVAAASTVADAASVSLGSCLPSGVDGDRLSRLAADGMVVESLERREREDFQAINVVERYMNAAKIYLPLHLANAWQMGAKMKRWRQTFATSSLGGVIRDVCFAPNGAYAACAGTNGLALVLSLQTLDDIVTVEQARQSNRHRGLLDWSSTSNKESSSSSTTAATGSAGSTTTTATATSTNLIGSNVSAIVTTQNANEITDLSIARRITGFAQSVEVIRFHPEQPLVLCGGRAGELTIHNVGPADLKMQLKVQDDLPVRTAAWHPSGEYVLFGTDHPTPRLLNIQSETIFAAPQTFLRASASASAAENAEEESGTPSPTLTPGPTPGGRQYHQHTAGLTAVEFAPDGRTWASASMDGSWVLCDGTSGKIIHKVPSAHSRVPVTSLVYSRSGNVILTSGMDSTARLWDLRFLSRQQHGGGGYHHRGSSTSGASAGSSSPSTRPPIGISNTSGEVMSFGVPGKCEHRSIRAVFSSDESHILCQGADLMTIHGYCVYSGDEVYSLATDPPLMQRGLAVSPYGNTVITGGDDCRLRLWRPSFVPTT